MKSIWELSPNWCNIWLRRSVLDWDIQKRSDKMWIENLRKTNGTKENEMLTENGNEKMRKTKTKRTQKGNYMVHWFHYQYDDDVPFFYFIFPFAIMSSYDSTLCLVSLCILSQSSILNCAFVFLPCRGCYAFGGRWIDQANPSNIHQDSLGTVIR